MNSEGALSYEDKIAIAEQSLEVMQHLEFKAQVQAFLSGLASIWPEYDEHRIILHDEVLRLINNMIQFGIVHERGLPIDALRLTDEDVVRYEADAIRYRQDVLHEMIGTAVPLPMENYEPPPN